MKEQFRNAPGPSKMADGRIKHIKNPKNQTTTFTYSFDQGTKQTTETSTDFLGVSTTRIYDLSGNLIESRDAFGTVTKYEYNSLNQLKTTKDYLDRVMNTNDYYADGNLKTVTDAYGNQTRYKYNYDGKITELKDALGNTTTYVYGGGAGCPSCGSSKDELTSVTDANNKTTTYEYYKNGWKKNQKDPLNHMTSYTYDPTGFMTSLTDPAQAVTAFDKTDLVTTKTDPLGRVTTYVYDKAGRLTTKTDRKGDVINYSYTPDNVLQTITYPDNSTVSFTNDELDRTTSMTNSLGTTTYLHDDANRKVTVTDPHGFVVVYKNDETGRLKELTYSGNKKVIYGYDPLNRMETVRLDWLNQTATYSYDNAGRLTSLTNFNGTVTTYGYDTANRLTSLENRKSDNTTIASYSFPILDGIGNRMQAEINEPLAPVLTPEQTGYTYNDKKNRLEAAGSTSFDYDTEGQLASVNADVFAFDYEHRMTAISGQQSAFSYSYSGKGDRLKATRNGETTYYIHDLSNNVLAEADGNKVITGLYIHGQGLLGMVTPADQVYSYHFNAIGSTIAMTDQSQNVVNAYSYSSFGSVLNQTETIPQLFKYVGQYGVMAESCELTAECFLYMRARYYDPKVGRFISEDPIGFDGGTVNLFEYVGNQPVNLIDPEGLASKGGGTEYFLGDCNADEMNECKAKCAGKGVESCKITYSYRSTVRNGEVRAATYKVPGSMSCVCKDDDCPKNPPPTFPFIVPFPGGSGGGCFIASTLVQTADGLNPIEEIKIGDMVLTWNENTSKNEFRRVVALIVAVRSDMVKVYIEPDELPLIASSNHRFYVKGKEWVKASEIKAGDTLVDNNSMEVTVRKVVLELYPEEIRVYNIEVEGLHNYYVGRRGILTHNRGLKDPAY